MLSSELKYCIYKILIFKINKGTFLGAKHETEKN